MTDNKFDDFDSRLDELLRLPRFSPSADFSDRVMSQVAVFQQRAPVRVPSIVPKIVRHPASSPESAWALPPAITKWIPQSRPARYALGALATVTSVATTAAAAVIVSQISLVGFIGGIVFDRMRVAITLWGAELINGALGQTALGYLNTAAPGQSSLILGGLVFGGVTAFAGLKRAASLTPARSYP